ncbi:MAG: stage 0 sporulation family protein [Desulfuromonadales bacterium]|nr:stage 0 sporulation family protein [Desulfuromonadales bacterium]
MVKIATVRFQPAGRQYDFNTQGLDLKPGDRVIVETDRGRAMATVVGPLREIDEQQAPDSLKKILRVASEEDMALAMTNAAREADAFSYGQRRIAERQMEMKLVRAEYAYDGSKIVFYFTAEGRIDFRELVKDLAHHFHTRIEMRQIGVRDEAKLVGGLGICGRELCCCTFLVDFTPVSVKMAKEQGLALNPTKISGQCGRLLCCLSYEYETYCHHKKGMPKCGRKVAWQGKEWEVTGQNVLCRKLTLRSAEGVNQAVTMEQLESDLPAKEADECAEEVRARGTKPAAAKTQESADTSRRRRRKPRPQEKSASADSGKDAAPAVAEQQQPVAAEGENQPGKRRRRRRRKPRGAERGGSPTQGE